MALDDHIIKKYFMVYLMTLICIGFIHHEIIF